MTVERIVWVLVHPTPYNIYLLNQLAERTDVRSEAVYRWETLPSHPWSALPERRFPWRVAEFAGGVDVELLAIAGREPRTLMIFAGWRDRMIAPLVARRWWSRLPFAFWMDTPRMTRNPARWVMNRLLVRAGRRAVAMLATGKPAIDAFIRMGFKPGSLLDFPFVVDPVHFGAAIAERERRYAATRDTSAVRFLQCGRLIDRLKGQTVAMQALAIAQSEEPSVRMELWIAGTGPDAEALRRRAEELGITAQVVFLGWTGYETLPRIFGQVDALLMPSHWDPFPVTVIEAMAAGLPVLGSSACGTVLERIEAGKTGYIHAPGDARALADHILQVVRSTEHRMAMGRAAAEASSDWGIERCVTAIDSLLQTRIG